MSCFGCRHVLALLGFLGFVVVYSLRVNLSVAVVAMTNSSSPSANATAECPVDPSDNSTSPNIGEFDWDEQTQGLILGSFFWGYIFTQIPGGMLAEVYGAKWIYGFGILWTAILTLLTPLVARWNLTALIILRVLEGVGEGVTFPSMHALLAQWVPPLERTKIGVFVYSGAQFGTILSLPISGYLCSSDIMGGWPSVFYIFGLAGCCWFLPWCFLVYNSPNEHPRISADEKTHILSSLGNTVSKAKKFDTSQYKALLTSLPVISVVCGHLAHNWTFYTVLTCIPTFLAKILNFNVMQDGFVSAMPYVALWFVMIGTSQLADLIRSKGWLSTTVVRRLFNTSGLLLEAVGLVLVGYIGCDRFLATAVLIITVGLSGLCSGGYAMNHLDLAPQFAGTLLGLTNTAATIPGMIAPVVVGAFTNHNQTRQQWIKVFFTTSAVTVAGAIIFLLFSSGELQSWAYNEQDHEENEPIVDEDVLNNDTVAIQA